MSSINPADQNPTRIGVVSDTHGHRELTQTAIRLLEPFAPRLVIHCGDIGAEEIIPLFAAWPTHFVLGNVDYGDPQWRRAIEAAGQTFHGRAGSLEIEGQRIAFLHSDDGALFRETIHSGKWDLVCYGHTHLARQERIGDTLVLNPGAVYRANPHSVAIVELPGLTVVSLKF